MFFFSMSSKLGIPQTQETDALYPSQACLSVPTFKFPVEKSIRSWTFGWVEPSPVTIDMKLSVSLRVVLSPMKRNEYLAARCSMVPLVVRACGGRMVSKTRVAHGKSEAEGATHSQVFAYRRKER